MDSSVAGAEKHQSAGPSDAASAESMWTDSSLQQGQDQSAGTNEPAAKSPKRPRHPPGMFRVHKHRAGKRVQAKRKLRDLGLDTTISFKSPLK